MPSNDWVEDVAGYLNDSGIGFTANLSPSTFGIFVNNRPSQKLDRLIILTDTGGTPPADNIPGLRRPTFQVKVVAAKSDPAGGKAKIEAIYNLISGAVAVIQNGREFDFFVALQHPTFLGIDEGGAFVYSNNYQTQMREAVS